MRKEYKQLTDEQIEHIITILGVNTSKEVQMCNSHPSDPAAEFVEVDLFDDYAGLIIDAYEAIQDLYDEAEAPKKEPSY